MVIITLFDFLCCRQAATDAGTLNIILGQRCHLFVRPSVTLLLPFAWTRAVGVAVFIIEMGLWRNKSRVTRSSRQWRRWYRWSRRSRLCGGSSFEWVDYLRNGCFEPILRLACRIVLVPFQEFRDFRGFVMIDRKWKCRENRPSITIRPSWRQGLLYVAPIMAPRWRLFKALTWSERKKKR